jgi:hypothetical protein
VGEGAGLDGLEVKTGNKLGGLFGGEADAGEQQESRQSATQPLCYQTQLRRNLELKLRQIHQHKLLILMVAGGGFEPPTFGL